MHRTLALSGCLLTLVCPASRAAAEPEPVSVTFELNGAQVKDAPRGELDPEGHINMGLLWNDPSEEVDDFQPNPKRGMGWVFGRKVFDEFLSNTGMKGIIRSHERFRDGYKYFFGDRLLSVYSSDSYGERIRPKIAIAEKSGFELAALD